MMFNIKSVYIIIVKNIKFIKSKYTILIASHSNAFSKIADKVINLDLNN